ncbi:putative bifunctional diguanylate cyclase/phosphodiesterase [Paractinoplanes hotanensis]|uniref:EAL domain-containing protein n=1 Tax=Paractinoplanes hotanensis TaxID=2906497 RepID=A0ABT0XS83_9ACTN|nr:EAL domain-containing protein [Actinoplanes hotanensis]MCM4076627.1 EAL domain-containing protein [Actinoplanes hotanensis]
MKSLRRDAVLMALVAVTVTGFVLFALFEGDPHRQSQVFWCAQVPMDAALAYGAWRLRALVPHYRRFWTAIAFAGSSFTVGDGFQAGYVLLHPAIASTSGTAVQSAFFIVGMLSNVLACLLFPHGLRSARERLVFWLDATTVLVGGGAMAWVFAVYPVTAPADRVTASITAALVVVGAFAATKAALVPRPPMARIAAWPMVAAPVVQGLVAFLPGPFQAQDRSYVFMVLLLPSLLIAIGPRIQERVVRADGPAPAVKRKPYSLLPYGMIAVTFAVFLISLPDDVSTRFWGATAGVVVITALVAARQLIAFQDNVRLIRRLDVALDHLTDQEVLLREQASTDGLTGLANRTHFTDQLQQHLEAGRSPSVLLIDLDDFKTVNDTMGHAAGDALLVEVAERLRATVRADDLVSRLGGDEFTILLPGTGSEDARRIADELQSVLAGHTRASIGVAWARPGDEPATLLSNADIAMYEAKRRGKGTSVSFSDEMGARTAADAEITRDLATAVDAGEFTLVYQPIVSLDDLRMTGVEALIRWNHPTRGLVSPAEFIPLAERSGHIVAIGAWALREACRQVARWRADFPGAYDLTVGVNVAGRQLRSPGFVDEVAAVLRDTGLPPNQLSIEVTETAVLDDEESSAALLGLRALGLRLALDDFGTAASSLGLLLTVPVTTLKLDRSFVESITTVGRQAAVANAVSQMATALDFSSVAEGIETEEQRELIRSLGYEYGQGYLFGRPLPPSQVVARLEALDGVVV